MREDATFTNDYTTLDSTFCYFAQIFMICNFLEFILQLLCMVTPNELAHYN
jgi:hypothetical protein